MTRRRPSPAEPARAGRRRPGQGNQVRIVGGTHRGRRLSFPDSEGLRPTSDRTRETLFNWLQMQLPGARCLDLFAGSGALGFEAASRGAAEVTLLERSPRVARHLQDTSHLLGFENVTLHCVDALAWLEQTGSAYDIVFLDPPFADDLLTACCRSLEAGGWLAATSRIYLEWDLHGPAPALPSGWVRLKEKRAGQVAYALYGR